jgi:hypothetical protein
LHVGGVSPAWRVVRRRTLVIVVGSICRGVWWLIRWRGPRRVLAKNVDEAVSVKARLVEWQAAATVR